MKIAARTRSAANRRSRISVFGPATQAGPPPASITPVSSASAAFLKSGHNPFSDSVQNQVRRPTHLQLLENILAVRLHRVNAQEQAAGDLFVAVAFGDELQHFALAFR